jgi:hypothetical protein
VVFTPAPWCPAHFFNPTSRGRAAGRRVLVYPQQHAYVLSILALLLKLTAAAAAFYFYFWHRTGGHLPNLLKSVVIMNAIYYTFLSFGALIG